MQSFDLQGIGRKFGMSEIALPFPMEMSMDSTVPFMSIMGMISRSKEAIVVGLGSALLILLYFSRGITAVYARIGSEAWCLMRILSSLFVGTGTTFSSRDTGR